MSKKSVLFLAFIIPFTVLYMGCAFGTRHVNLRPVYVQGFDQIADSSASSLQLPLPADQRAIKTSVGCVRNGFGMKTAKVVANGNVPDWVHATVKENLKKCGFHVLDEQAESSGDQEPVVVAIDLFRVYCDSYMQYDASVELNAMVKQNGQIITQRTIVGDAQSTNWAASSAGYEKTLHAAMQDCMNQLIPYLYTAITEKAIVTNQ